ncbi:MAG: chlorite dismutase family protein [Acidobacteria bacterium]|nr:chlorite dismutase family protein [Acidobacteriota bacterium]
MGNTENTGDAGRSSLRLAGNASEAERPRPTLPRQFVNFAFYRARPEWRMLDEAEKASAKQEYLNVLDKFRGEMLIHTYSLVGLRTNAEMMIWRIGYALDPFQEMTTLLNRTRLGQYLEATQSFLSMTKRSMYIDKDNPEHVEDRLHIVPGRSSYLFVYPFVKTRDWYTRSPEQRQEMMDEHIRIGSKYRSVKLHTTYSFGLDDQEFVVAFETEEPADFLDLVQELRETKASSFTLRDTPMFTCRQRTLAECLDALG